MAGKTPLGLENQDQALLESGDSVAATPANVADMSGAPPGSVAWLSTRSEYWPPHVSEHWPPPDFKPIPGVACLQFGIGADGAGWLARLARSSWFAGLEPRAEDLAVSGGVACGCWAMPDDWADRTGASIASEAEAFFASKPLPKACLALVAVPRGAEPDEQAVALGLVGALRARCDPSGRALGVVVTVEAAPSTEADAFVRALLDKGAFVVRGGAGPDTGAVGDLLHHFPLRALKEPRLGRLVCVDLADYLYIWRPARLANLHVVPLAGHDTVHALRGALLLAGDGVCALTLGFHLDLDAPGQGLAEVDGFAAVCCTLLPTTDGDVVFTNMDRLDGVTGSVDLLVIHDSVVVGG